MKGAAMHKGAASPRAAQCKGEFYARGLPVLRRDRLQPNEFGFNLALSVDDRPLPISDCLKSAANGLNLSLTAGRRQPAKKGVQAGVQFEHPARQLAPLPIEIGVLGLEALLLFGTPSRIWCPLRLVSGHAIMLMM